MADDPSLEAVPVSGQSLEARNREVLAVRKGLSDLGAVVFFEKPLTSSDTSGSGRVVIPKVGGRDLGAALSITHRTGHHERAPLRGLSREHERGSGQLHCLHAGARKLHACRRAAQGRPLALP
jgi:hypothetical protein